MCRAFLTLLIIDMIFAFSMLAIGLTKEEGSQAIFGKLFGAGALLMLVFAFGFAITCAICGQKYYDKTGRMPPQLKLIPFILGKKQ